MLRAQKCPMSLLLTPRGGRGIPPPQEQKVPCACSWEGRDPRIPRGTASDFHLCRVCEQEESILLGCEFPPK